MMADVQRDKVVYFVRHGQSEDNVAPVFQSPDSPLSAVGRAQAVRIAERVAKLSFQALLASPYRRAQETAAVIGTITGKVPEFVELFTGLCRKFCSCGREGVVAPVGGEIRRPGSRTVRPQ